MRKGMKIYKTSYVNRWAKHEEIEDAQLKNVISELEQGFHDGHLGGGVYKKRVAARGKGK